MKIVLKPIWVPTVSLLLFALYWLIFIDPFFPTASGVLGHDYRGNLSEMFIGFIHYHSNNALEVPWFTPATCAGNMFVAGVASPYFNVQQ